MEPFDGPEVRTRYPRTVFSRDPNGVLPMGGSQWRAKRRQCGSYGCLLVGPQGVQNRYKQAPLADRLRLDTITPRPPRAGRVVPVSVMAPSDLAAAQAPVPASPTNERLAQQLNLLSQVMETLTYRVLELEERLAAQELRLQALKEQSSPTSTLDPAAEWRLDDTEQRLQQLEALLSGLEGTPASRHLQPVAEPGLANASAPIDGPFLDEPEQPFMDELIEEDDLLAAELRA